MWAMFDLILQISLAGIGVLFLGGVSWLRLLFCFICVLGGQGKSFRDRGSHSDLANVFC